MEKLKHGWYCVRNRSTEEIRSGVSIPQRHEKERKFFNTSPWNVLEKKRVGIDALKLNVGRLLSQHISREFPLIRKEIETQYMQCRKELGQLGAPRQSSHDHVQYLIRLAMAYRRLVEDNLTGRYQASGMDPSKLRMHVQNAGDRFKDDMEKNGCTMRFKSVEEDLSPISNALSDGARQEPVEDEEGIQELDIYQEISQLWRTSRGPELPGKLLNAVFDPVVSKQLTSRIH